MRRPRFIPAYKVRRALRQLAIEQLGVWRAPGRIVWCSAMRPIGEA
jgi:hypothetical protein